MKTKQKGFTMVELLTVIGIVAILAVVVVLAINPQQLLMQSRDSNRVGSLTTIVTSVALAKSEGLSLGTPNVAYISIPDPTLTGNQTSTCASLGLPALASTTYQCVSPANVAKDNGTGWIPIAFTSLPGGFPLGSLPVDPVNTTSSNEYFIYTTNGTGYEVMANPEAAKNASNTSSFVQGSNLALVTSFPTGSSGGGTSGQNIWVGDMNNKRVEEFSLSGKYLSQFGTPGSGNGQFDFLIPQAFAISLALPILPAISSNGTIWVTDMGNYRVEEFSSAGIYESQLGCSSGACSAGSSNGQFTNPSGIAIDASGNIWVADMGNNRVEEFSSAGTYKGQLGCSSGACSAGSSNGQFNSPWGITIH
jgi:prepilin-type N-terminal cleavage/methylation domain-containing protein